jgi:hypothetical protein
MHPSADFDSFRETFHHDYAHSLDKGWIKQPHLEPKTTSDRVAYKIVRFLRVLSDMYFKRRLIARACL